MVNGYGIKVQTHSKQSSILCHFWRKSLGIKHLLLIHDLADGVFPSRFVLCQPFIQRAFPT